VLKEQAVAELVECWDLSAQGLEETAQHCFLGRFVWLLIELVPDWRQ
jgi:hypothetical protein